MPRMQGNSVTIGGRASNFFFIDWSSSDEPGNNRTLIYWNAYFHFDGADAQLDNGNAYLNGYRWQNGGRVYNYAGNFSVRDLHLAGGSFYVDHDANGNASLGVSGGITVYGGVRSEGGYTWGLSNYDRKPTTPTSVGATVNADKTITVTVNGVSSPAGTPTYYIQTSQNGGAFGNQQSSSSATFIVSGLLPGQNYQFRGWATNSDGTGGTRDSATVFLPSGGKIFNGTSWVPTTIARRYDGTNWVDITTAKIYNGSSWVNLQ